MELRESDASGCPQNWLIRKCRNGRLTQDIHGRCKRPRLGDNHRDVLLDLFESDYVCIHITQHGANLKCEYAWRYQ
jgi:hypothetical protein